MNELPSKNLDNNLVHSSFFSPNPREKRQYAAAIPAKAAYVGGSSYNAIPRKQSSINCGKYIVFIGMENICFVVICFVVK
ncbi:unnamed protein product [Meloidogyne enterolobii]|uniref:Uncharacterized protein n=1 Tax=Meloidogyne enterolobii TaxID=390850 RepID=A0ACB0ZV78_MELEN